MAKRVDVQDFLKDAKPKSKTECPMALALKAAYDAGRVEVEGSRITIFDNEGKVVTEGDVSMDMAESIKHYDDTGEWVGQTHFFISSPSEAFWQRLGSEAAISDYHRE